MDPVVVTSLANALAPVAAILATFGMPVAIVYIVKHFKLRDRELLLEEKIAERGGSAQVDARLARLETALTAVLQRLEQQAPADAPALDRASWEAPSSIDEQQPGLPAAPTRTR